MDKLLLLSINKKGTNPNRTLKKLRIVISKPKKAISNSILNNDMAFFIADESSQMSN